MRSISESSRCALNRRLNGKGPTMIKAFAAALLFLPFALFSANRNLQLRDSLPLIYLSYAALGVTAAAVIGFVRARIRQPMGDVLVAAALIAFGGAFALQQAATFRSHR